MSNITENPNKDWSKAVLDLGVSMHPDSLRKSWNSGRYSGYNVMKYFQNKQTKYLADEEIERIEMLKDELYKERCKLADQNRERRKYLREQSRFETLVEVLKDEIENLEPIHLKEYSGKRFNKNVYAVAQFSDWHLLKLVDNQWNIYNKDIAVERVNIITDKIINKSKIHNVSHLIVEINGDIIDGLIQVSARNVEEADVIKQIIFAGELLSQVINKLKPNYKSIKIVTTLGNHGRLFENKKMCTTKENFESLIPYMINLRLNHSVPIIQSYGYDFVSYEIDNKSICVAHGQNDKLSTVISDFSKIYKKVPNEIHLGHTHSYKDINDCDINITVNGSLVGTDDYALSIRKVTKPAQNLIIYDNDDRCIYNLIAE